MSLSRKLSNIPSRDPREVRTEAVHAPGVQSLNESIPEEQRTPGVLGAEQSGPRIGAAGEYLPASYRTRNGFLREDR